MENNTEFTMLVAAGATATAGVITVAAQVAIDVYARVTSRRLRRKQQLLRLQREYMENADEFQEILELAGLRQQYVEGEPQVLLEERVVGDAPMSLAIRVAADVRRRVGGALSRTPANRVVAARMVNQAFDELKRKHLRDVDADRAFPFAVAGCFVASLNELMAVQMLAPPQKSWWTKLVECFTGAEETPADRIYAYDQAMTQFSA